MSCLAVAHAIAFLTAPLHTLYPPSVIATLRLLLEANLSLSDAFLELDPATLPPKPIYAACIASGIRWSNWISCFKNQHMLLFIHSRHVAVRANDCFFTIWEDTTPQQPPMVTDKKTLAQQIIEADDDEGNQIFSMLAARLSMPMAAPTPITDSFSVPPRVPSPISRSSSRTSNSSSSDLSTDSLFSTVTTSSSISSVSSVTPPSKKYPRSIISRRERARLARVFIDKSKSIVTPYDGGRTGVLTGGVMLGGRSPNVSAPSIRSKSSDTGNWRRL